MIKPYYQDKSCNQTINCGDALNLMQSMYDNSIDSIVTDPPYGLEFMGKEWDKFKIEQHSYKETKGILKIPSGHGKKWTQVERNAYQEWTTKWAKEALRVAKPGAFLLAFGGTRTFHRLTCGIEDAGWEIRDCLMWLYGSGFPKSLDISKTIDKRRRRDYISIAKKLGLLPKDANRSFIDWTKEGHSPSDKYWEDFKKLIPREDWIKIEREIVGNNPRKAGWFTIQNGHDITIPATPEAQTWNAWGTALKPAWEPIIVAMKSLDGTFSQNALKHGVGGLWIDGCRIEGAKGDGVWGTNQFNCQSTFNDSPNNKQYKTEQHSKGRWPANLILSHHPDCVEGGVKKIKIGDPDRFAKTDGGWGVKKFHKPPKINIGNPNGTETVKIWDCHPDCAVKMLDEQSGKLKSGSMLKPYKYTNTGHSMGKPAGFTKQIHNSDTGHASRFFYCAKSSRSEREEGLKSHIPCVKCGSMNSEYHTDDKGNKIKCIRNDHPTVKPLALMQYLCKLTKTPTDGIVLDMFGGTGTTAVACKMIGRKCILFEKEEANCKIAMARLNSGKMAQKVIEF